MKMIIILKPCYVSASAEKYLFDGMNYIPSKELNAYRQTKEEQGHKVLIDLTGISNPSEWYF